MTGRILVLSMIIFAPVLVCLSVLISHLKYLEFTIVLHATETVYDMNRQAQCSQPKSSNKVTAANI